MKDKIYIFSLLNIMSALFFFPIFKGDTKCNINIILVVLIEFFLNILLCVVIILLIQEKKFRKKGQIKSIYTHSQGRLFYIIAICLLLVFYIVKSILLLYGNLILLLIILPMTSLYAFLFMIVSTNKIIYTDSELKTYNFTLKINEIEDIKIVEHNEKYDLFISVDKNQYSITATKYMLEELIKILPKNVAVIKS